MNTERAFFAATLGLLLGVSNMFAANVEVILESDDGSDAFVVFDSSTTQVARVTSDGGVLFGTGSPVADFQVIGQTGRCDVLFAPDWPSSGEDSQLMLAEDDNGTHGMILRYNGGSNAFYVIGKNSTAYRGPHLAIKRDSPTRVGVGMSNPTSTLHVAGDVTASGDYLYDAVRTNYCFLGASGFRPVSNTEEATYTHYWGGIYIKSDSPDSALWLTRDINLPHGARVTGFDTYYLDDDASNSLDMTIELLYQDLSGDFAAANVIKSHSFTAMSSSSSIRSARADVSTTDNLVDHENHVTFMNVTFNPEATGSDFIFYGVRVEYTLPGPM